VFGIYGSPGCGECKHEVARRRARPRSATSVRSSHVLLVNFLAAWMAAFATTSINIALPAIQTELHLGAVALGWLPLAYILSSAVFLLPLGKVGIGLGDGSFS